MIPIALFVIVMLVILGFVAAPLFRSPVSRNSNHKHKTEGVNDLLERKETIYSHIKDIEFDYQMGKLSEEDFQNLRQQYKDEAVAVLRQIDQVQGTKVPAKTMVQKQKARDPKDPAAVNFCWMCGTAVSKTDKFCANCGNQVH